MTGGFYQCLEITLQQDECVFAKRGTLVCMDSGIRQTVIMNGSGIRDIVSAKLSGESIFLIKYTNTRDQPQNLTLSGRQGAIYPFQLTSGHTLIVRRKDYISSSRLVAIDIHLSYNKMLKGTEPAFQKLRGDAVVFFSYLGNLVKRELQPGEDIIVDEDRIKALYDIGDSQINWQKHGSILRNMIAGEGMFLTRITGPGTICLSSEPLIRK